MIKRTRPQAPHVRLDYGDCKSFALGGGKTLSREQEAALFEAQGWERVADGWRMRGDGKPVTLEINLADATPKSDRKRRRKSIKTLIDIAERAGLHVAKLNPDGSVEITPRGDDATPAATGACKREIIL
jgi:hypothetical protein